MLSLGCLTVEEYIEILSLKTDIRAACRLHLTVSISRFFRDKRLWEGLEKQFLNCMPLLLLHNHMTKPEDAIRSWKATVLKIVFQDLPIDVYHGKNG